MKHTYDKCTAGFRTIRNLRGYDDSERDFPPSEVDDSEYEDINVLVKRFMRGEIVHAGRAGTYDGDNQDPVALMDQMSPFEQDGADLADVPVIQEGLKSRAKARKAVKATPPTPSEEKPKEGTGEAGSGATK